MRLHHHLQVLHMAHSMRLLIATYQQTHTKLMMSYFTMTHSIKYLIVVLLIVMNQEQMVLDGLICIQLNGRQVNPIHKEISSFMTIRFGKQLLVMD